MLFYVLIRPKCMQQIFYCYMRAVMKQHIFNLLHQILNFTVWLFRNFNIFNGYFTLSFFINTLLLEFLSSVQSC